MNCWYPSLEAILYDNILWADCFKKVNKKKWSYSVYRGDLRDFEYWDIPNAAMASLRLFSNAN